MTESRPLRFATDALRRARWMARRALRLQLRIVVETRWRLGDEIMAIPIYEGIKRRYPFCRLTVWCNHPDVLLRNPHVDRVMGADEQPEAMACDRYILLRGAPRDTFRLDHYARRAGIPAPRTSPRLYYDDWNTAHLSKAKLEHKRFIAVCTGATWQTKRWPLDSWHALCASLTGDGNTIVQLGAKDERIAGTHDLLDKTTVREAARVLRSARLLIACDSGLMHLALAVGTPVLALFGPTDPTILVGENVPLSVLTNGRDCKGCWNHSSQAMEEGSCPLGISPCMGTLTVEAVLARARELLGAGP